MKASFKKLPLSDCILDDNRIDIWQYPLHTEFKSARDLLSEDESARAKRYHFARHQRRFTVARAVLRLILARYLKLLPTELIFNYSEHGKPEIANRPLIQFNLSHSGELALLAVGKTYPLGIDLELFSARPYEGIGKHLFSLTENTILRHTNLQLKPLVFFNTWAQKEAFIKASGLGLSYPTQQFNVEPLPSTNQEIFDTLHQKIWKMFSFMPEVACSAALCCQPEVTEIRYLKLDKLDSIILKSNS